MEEPTVEAILTVALVIVMASSGQRFQPPRAQPHVGPRTQISSQRSLGEVAAMEMMQLALQAQEFSLVIKPSDQISI